MDNDLPVLRANTEEELEQEMDRLGLSDGEWHGVQIDNRARLELIDSATIYNQPIPNKESSRE